MCALSWLWKPLNKLLNKPLNKPPDPAAVWKLRQVPSWHGSCRLNLLKSMQCMIQIHHM